MDRSATAGLELTVLSFSLSCSFGISGLAPSPRSCGWHGGKGTHRGPLLRGLAVGERPEDFSGLLIGKAAGGGLNWTQKRPQRPGPFITFPFFVLTRCRGPDTASAVPVASYPIAGCWGARIWWGSRRLSSLPWTSSVAAATPGRPCIKLPAQGTFIHHPFSPILLFPSAHQHCPVHPLRLLTGANPLRVLGNQ